MCAAAKSEHTANNKPEMIPVTNAASHCFHFATRRLYLLPVYLRVKLSPQMYAPPVHPEYKLICKMQSLHQLWTQTPTIRAKWRVWGCRHADAPRDAPWCRFESGRRGKREGTTWGVSGFYLPLWKIQNLADLIRTCTWSMKSSGKVGQSEDHCEEFEVCSELSSTQYHIWKPCQALWWGFLIGFSHVEDCYIWLCWVLNFLMCCWGQWCIVERAKEFWS